MRNEFGVADAHQHLATILSKPRTAPVTWWDKTLSTKIYSARLTQQKRNKKTLNDMQGLFDGADWKA